MSTTRPTKPVTPRIWNGWHDLPTLTVLKTILGKVLVHEQRGRRVSGVIVEAEAYIGEDDPACHAAAGLTRRNAPLYGPPGRAYVYLNYGLHYLVNAVTEREGYPGAVLIRALVPLEGIDLMRRRRGPVPDARLCNGPGNLTQALGINLRHNLVDLATSNVRLEDHGFEVGPIDYSPRIGIRVGTDRLWRATCEVDL
ncbi:MAG: DNA-3-methyladenine glycosylase [Acidobacteria bacterium]|jgi:DNA-3-methyladenine glycosylase|nr:DNA-3-methyladenine glycosylase [Acidobacteriota bacterium]